MLLQVVQLVPPGGLLEQLLVPPWAVSQAQQPEVSSASSMGQEVGVSE